MNEIGKKTLERRLRAQLVRDRQHPSRCDRDGDTILVHPSGTACGLALAIELLTGEDSITVMNRVGARDG